MGKSKIDWCDYVWNPVTGCSKVSEGCRNCYAERLAKRFWGERKFTDVQCHEDRLGFPQTIKKPSWIFVNSMSDLFHKDVPDSFIHNVMGKMLAKPQHIFIILTKRPERMKRFIEYFPYFGGLKNVIYGVSVEDQDSADERIPILLATRVMNRMVSIEPMIGDVNMVRYLGLRGDRLDWVIVGGESGPGARPMKAEWANEIQKDCAFVNVPFFFKQWGEFDANGDRVGKAAAGHLLNGVEYHEYPRGFFMGQREA